MGVRDLAPHIHLFTSHHQTPLHGTSHPNLGIDRFESKRSRTRSKMLLGCRVPMPVKADVTSARRRVSASSTHQSLEGERGFYSRRDVFIGFAGASFFLSLPSFAAESPLGIGQPVRPALSPAAYARIIRDQHDIVISLLRELAQRGAFTELSLSLVLPPFDAFRQACYFIPWALVPVNEAAGTELERIYSEQIRPCWMALDAAALAAASDGEAAPSVDKAIDAFDKATLVFMTGEAKCTAGG